MSNSVHQFSQSKKVEVSSTSLHDLVFLHYQSQLNKQNNRSFVARVDRDSCNYNTTKGKAYQQADTDTLLHLNCDHTQVNIVKNISEKTRTKFYNDLYIEVVSVLKWNTQSKRYEFEAPGWGLRNEQLGPDCLSMLFLDKKANNYTSIFIDDYKTLKAKLFNTELSQTLQSERFAVWLNKKIQEAEKAGKTNFQLSTEGESKNNVSKVIFAKNKGYYTIGFTYTIDYIKSLKVNILKSKGMIVDQNSNSISY